MPTNFRPRLAVLLTGLLASLTMFRSEVAYSEVIERGRDFEVHRSIIPVIDPQGGTSFKTNQFTLVETALNYFENGQWKGSEDLVESFENGAVARRGPNKAIFSNKLKADAVFDIEAADGKRVRGGLRAIQLSDVVTGNIQVLGEVKSSVKGEILPPNKIVYPDAFKDIAADVLLIWQHNSFSHDLILKQRPILPQNWNPATTRFEVLTEFLLDFEPELRTQRVTVPGQGELDDDVVIRFGSLSMLLGKAFLSSGGTNVVIGNMPPADVGTPVLKQWHVTPDGRRFLIESVAWSDIEQQWQNLPPMAQALNSSESEGKKAFARTWPERSILPEEPEAMQLASAAYKLEGYVLDFFIVPETSVTTFQTGITYYVKDNYINDSTVTFQSNTIIKFKNATYMRLSGSISFPASQPYAIFTSRDDDLFGETIRGLTGAPHFEPDSDGNPTDHQASQAISIYFVDTNKTINNARVRWAVKGIQFDGNGGVFVTHTLSNSIFEQCQIAMRNNLPSGSVALSNVKECGVLTPISGPGLYTGSITTDCGVVNASQFLKHQYEPAIAVRQNPSDTSQSQIVIVAMHPPESSEASAMLRMISNDSGSTWSRNVIASGTDALLPAATDSDPSVSFDSFGNLFLAYRASSGGGIVAALYVSTDAGGTWATVPGFDGSGANGATPRVATGPSGKAGVPASVWVSLNQTPAGVTATGTEVRGQGAANIGNIWTAQTTFPNSNVHASGFSTISIGPNGEVLVAYIMGTGTYPHQAPVTCYTVLDSDGVSSTNSFVSKGSFGINVGWELIPAMGNLGEMVPIPTVEWDRARNVLYIAYPDKTTQSGESDDNIDIYVRYSSNGGTSWSGRVKINDDSTTTSQFHPRLAIDQETGKVALSWYDCRKDTAANTKTHFYAAVSQDAFSTAPPRNFQLNPLQSDVTIFSPLRDYREYVGLAFFKGYLYPVWIDNSNSTQNNPDGTAKFDVFTARVPF